MKKVFLLLTVVLFVLVGNAQSKRASISNVRKISATEGGFTGPLHEADEFGAVSCIGDIDNNNVEDYAIGAPSDPDGGNLSGAVWILLMNDDGSIKIQNKIGNGEGILSGLLKGSRFGNYIEPIGDFDLDGVPDIVVGAYYDNNKAGAIWILMLNNDGTVKDYKKISSNQGGLVGLSSNKMFGSSIANLGDIDNDGLIDLAIGSPNAYSYSGSFWMISVDRNGLVENQSIIAEGLGGFNENLDYDDRFGRIVSNIGDLNKDGIPDLTVSVEGDDDGGSDAGAFYLIFLNRDKTIKGYQKVSATYGGLNTEINAGDRFGFSSCGLGDVDNDGINDLLVSSINADDGGPDIGKVFLLYMNIDGTVKDFEEINSSTIAPYYILSEGDYFGGFLSNVEGFTSDGKRRVLISAQRDDDGFTDAGAVYIVDLEVAESKQAPISNVRKISAIEGGFTGPLHEADQFAHAEVIGDVDGDGIEDMAVGASGDNNYTGAVWILFMNSDRTVKRSQKINETEGGFLGDLDLDDSFGWSLTALGDFNNDGIPDLAAGAYFDGDGGYRRGAVWLLFLNEDGTVKDYRKISSTNGGLTGLTNNRMFGAAVECIGDIDNDGITDLAVGTPLWDNDGGTYRGCVWILFLNADGSVKAQQRINNSEGDLGNVLDDRDMFGYGIACLDDVNGDGINDIAVGAYGDDDSISDGGACYVLFLNEDGTVKSKQKISATEGNFKGLIQTGDLFCYKLSSLGDIDGNGVSELAVSSNSSDDGGADRGKVWILYLNNDGTVIDYKEISSLTQGFESLLDDNDRLGISLTYFQQLNENHKKEIVIGASRDDDGFTDAGAVYIMDLDVKHKPIASAGENLSVCSGDSFSLDGTTSSVLDNDPLEYLWQSLDYNLNNNTSATLNLIAQDVQEITDIEFILSVTCDGIVADPDTVIVTVYPELDQPQIVRSQDSLTASFDGALFEWYLNGEILADKATETITVTKSGYYQVKAFNEISCASELSDSLLVILNPVAVISGKNEYCANDNIELNAQVLEKSSNSTINYLWRCNQLEFSDSTSETLIIPALGLESDLELEVYLTVEQDGRYSNTDTLTIVVHPQPAKPLIDVQENNLSILNNSFAIEWFLNGEFIQHAIDSVYVAVANGMYQVQTTNSYGCSSEMSEEVEILMVPEAKAYGSKKVCSGTMIYLDGSESSSPVAGNLNYHWTCSKMEVPDANVVDPSFIAPKVQTITNYEFYLQVSQNSIYSPLDTFVVTVNPAPSQPELEQFADTLLTSVASEYQWFLNGVEVDGATRQTYIVSSSGFYYVKVANEYGCVSDPSRELNVFKTGVDQKSSDFSVYPNPANSFVSISGLPSGLSKVKLYNLTGELQMSEETDTGYLTIDLSGMLPGIYMLVVDDNWQRAFKVVKTN